jgi:ADP-ribosylglycohydrolase
MTGKYYDQILGSLALAGIGDAMGAATELWSTKEIVKKYGGLVTKFYEPPLDTFAGVNRAKAGQITDDASQMYYLAETLIATEGTLTSQAWITCLLKWADESPYATYMGPSTSAAVEAIRTGADPLKIGLLEGTDRHFPNIGTTNGAAMRVAPIGMVSPGDIETVCRNVLITCLPSHNTDVAVSATCAIAAGVAEALIDGATTESVVKACLEGAILGETIGGKLVRNVPGPRIVTRIKLAIDLAQKANSLEEIIEDLEAHIGNSVAASEAVPVAIGLVMYAQRNPIEAVIGGVNIGNDTDTIACMAGALVGALHGIKIVPTTLYEEFIQVNINECDVAQLAEGLSRIAIQ